MGREWLFWVGGMGRRRRRVPAEMREEDEGTSQPGCMCAVFQLFDLQQFQLPLNHQHSLNSSPFLHQEATSLKGVEAPRNSLEVEEPAAMKAASKPLPMTEEENLNFPVGINQIKTRASISSSKSKTEAFASDCSTTSPGLKTPTLVARLMGLDLLPESGSPSNPRPKSHLHPKPHRNRYFSDDDISVGARSLPETPRISSARRSEVEYHHRRLSLQINKENVNEEIAKMAGKRGRFRNQDENRGGCLSPGHYAKQIAKQVKESVSRRVGLMDITNTNRDEIRRDQNLLPLKLNKKQGKPVAETSIKSPRNPASSSESYNQGISTEMKPKNQTTIQEHQQVNRCSKADAGKSRRAKKFSHQSCDQGMRNKKEEPFVRKANLVEKKSKRGPLSSELLHISGPTLLPVKKDPSPPVAKLPQKQPQAASSSDALSSKRNTRLSCNSSLSYKHRNNQPDRLSTVLENVLPDSTDCCASAVPEYKCYVQKILKRAGIIDGFTPTTLGKWHTASHPLDPSIFYYLELFHPSAAASTILSLRCNRKLVFHLVDELLAGILGPHLDFKPWVTPTLRNNDHFALDDELCKRIEDFPAANCEVLEDIDSLIDRDLCNSSPVNVYFEEEWEDLVREIEGEIVEWLVRETAAMVGVRTDEGRRRQIKWMSRGDSRD